MHGRFHIAIVAHLYGDLGALIDVEGRTRNRSVVGEHAQISTAQVLADWRDVEVETISVAQANETGWPHRFNSRSLGRKQLVDRHVVIPSFDVLELQSDVLELARAMQMVLDR